MKVNFFQLTTFLEKALKVYINTEICEDVHDHCDFSGFLNIPLHTPTCNPHAEESWWIHETLNPWKKISPSVSHEKITNASTIRKNAMVSIGSPILPLLVYDSLELEVISFSVDIHQSSIRPNSDASLYSSLEHVRKFPSLEADFHKKCQSREA